MDDISGEIKSLREEWYAENRKEYPKDDGTLTCPAFSMQCTCNEALALHLQNREAARNMFYAKKDNELAKKSESGKSKNAQLDKVTAENAAIEKKLRDMEASHKEAAESYLREIARLKEALNNTTLAGARGVIDPADLPEWAEIENKIQFLSASIPERKEAGNDELTSRKRELQTRLDGIKQQLALRGIIEANARRRAELLKEEKDLAQQKADLEKQEFTADSLVREQMSEVERRVNMRFGLVRFKMFSLQINGGEKPDCIMTGRDGAKYADSNSAGKVAMGIDIINAFCKFYGITAPVFIDNRESVTEIPDTESQIINLAVDSSCKDLVIS
jgi:hypothetical protein